MVPRQTHHHGLILAHEESQRDAYLLLPLIGVFLDGSTFTVVSLLLPIWTTAIGVISLMTI
ncbi:MAG: hypothetical protein A3K67_02535 [Euryarchaeota archaeon RBG_16_62_10]|nr:MAG: hypothetical protein A3K67_02535 [Euryarchaeota archaeon RBG_16_62_10]